MQAILIETRQQRYGDLETKRAAFYSRADVAGFKKSLLETVNTANGDGCAKRDWIWQAQPSNLDRERSARGGFWRKPSSDFGALTIQTLHVEAQQVGHDSAVTGGYSSWVWGSCASE